ncbi:hypothetical protein GOBAR_DD13120 [Gossypium barbadense]|nr:hypothetical protein GOBAR_DD13120 [Gossypium barbadense]
MDVNAWSERSMNANINWDQYIDDAHTLEHVLCILGNEFPTFKDLSTWEMTSPPFELLLDLRLRRVPNGLP